MNTKEKEFTILEKEYLDQFPDDGQKTIGALFFAFGGEETMKILSGRNGKKIVITYDEESLDKAEYSYE